MIPKLIEDEIRYLLSNNLVKNMLVTGLDRSGKSTFITKFYNEYPVYKSGGREKLIDIDRLTNYYKIFDRHPYLEMSVYRDEVFAQNKIRTEEDYKCIKDFCIRKLNEEFNNSIYLFMLFPRYRNMRSDEFDFDAYDEVFTKRYLEIAERLMAMDNESIFYIIKPTGIKRISNLPEEGFNMSNQEEFSPNEDFKKLVDYANKYYNGLETGITDKEYDTLFDKVKLYFESFGKSFNIFDYVEFSGEYRKVRHALPFKVMPKTKVETFQNSLSLFDDERNCTTPKFDGSSIRCYYKDGKVHSILTRNDEYIGISQTEKLRNKVIQQVPAWVRCIDYESLTAVEDFGDACRGKSNGLINSKYLQEEVDKYLLEMPFYITTDPSIKKPYRELMNEVCGEGNWIELKKSDFANGDFRTVKFKGKTYPIDGIVIYNGTNDYILKYYFGDAVQTTVTNIEWNRSEYDYYIPKVKLDPIVIDGKNVKQAAGGSVDTVMGNHICKGAVVEVIMSGLTIPKVNKVLSYPTVEDYTIDKCWGCGGSLTYSTKGYYCNNPECVHYKEEAMSRFIEWIFNQNEQVPIKMNKMSDWDSVLNFIFQNVEFKDKFRSEIERLFVKGREHFFLAKDMIHISRLSKSAVNKMSSTLPSDDVTLDNVKRCFTMHMTDGNWEEFNMRSPAVFKLLNVINERVKSEFGFEIFK